MTTSGRKPTPPTARFPVVVGRVHSTTLAETLRPSDCDEVNAVCGAVVGGPIEGEARRVPRREIGLGEQHLAPLDNGERFRGQPATRIGSADATLAGRRSGTTRRSIGHAEAKDEVRSERLVGLAVRPQDDRLWGLAQPVSDRLTGRRNRVALRKAADGERGECRRRGPQKPGDGQESHQIQTTARERLVNVEGPTPCTRKLAGALPSGLTSSPSARWCGAVAGGSAHRGCE